MLFGFVCLDGGGDGELKRLARSRSCFDDARYACTCAASATDSLASVVLVVACSTQLVCAAEAGLSCASCLPAAPSEDGTTSTSRVSSSTSLLWSPSSLTCRSRDIRSLHSQAHILLITTTARALHTTPATTRQPRSILHSQRASSLALPPRALHRHPPANLAYSQQTTTTANTVASTTTTTATATTPPSHSSHAAAPPPNAAGLATTPSDSSFFRLRRPHSGGQIPTNLNVLRTHYRHPKPVVGPFATHATTTHDGQQLVQGLRLAQHRPSEQRAHLSKRSSILTSQP